MKQQRSGFSVMRRLIVLVRPLAPFMALAVLLGVAGFVCAIFLTILGGWAILEVLGLGAPLALGGLFACAAAFALLRGVLRYGEQACNHFIAFKLLALIRDKVFTALRRLCPAKLEGRDKGDLIAVITADIELLEVFYAHTISPAAIALVMSVGMSVFIGAYHPLLGLLAAAAYLTVGAALPVLIARLGGNTGAQFRAQAGALSGYVLDSLRGLREVLQYHQGENRLAGLEERTEGLLHTEERMKGRAAWSMALTNTVILTFSLGMLAAAAGLYFAGAVGFDGVLIPLNALMSSFGPVVALANLGSTLQNTLAAGNRVLDILDEEPLVHEIAGRQTTAFSGAACEDVSLRRRASPLPCEPAHPAGPRGGHYGAQRQRQIHAAASADALLGRGRRRGARLRPGRSGGEHRRSAAYGRLCDAGNAPLPRQHRQQPAHWEAGCDAGRAGGCLPKGFGTRIYPVPAQGV